jgi:acyl dehydratase
LPQLALIYRLSGDVNPLHVDPAIARKAGFDAPILHGLATYGLAASAMFEHVCGFDPARFGSFDARFTAPVIPGETIQTEIWVDGPVVSLRARSVEPAVIEQMRAVKVG